jgi:hypothetical protein
MQSAIDPRRVCRLVKRAGGRDVSGEFGHDVDEPAIHVPKRHGLPFSVVIFPHPGCRVSTDWWNEAGEDSLVRIPGGDLDHCRGYARHPGDVPWRILRKHRLHVDAEVDPVARHVKRPNRARRWMATLWEAPYPFQPAPRSALRVPRRSASTGRRPYRDLRRRR